MKERIQNKGKKNKYFDVRNKTTQPIRLFMTPRGIGKTYSALLEALQYYHDTGKRFLYMRLTDKEIERVCQFGNPFEEHNLQYGYGIESEYKSTQAMGTFTQVIDGEESVIGYSAPLSTFSSIRGLNFSDIGYILIDECIPERHRRSVIKELGLACANMYESINRNRELDGAAPVILVMLCNAIDLDSPLLKDMHLIEPIEDMIFNGETVYENPDRCLYIEYSKDAEILNDKKNTVIYRFMGKNSAFYQANLENKFVKDRLDLVADKVNLTEYIPVLVYGDITVYKHKSDKKLHIAKKKARCNNYISPDQKTLLGKQLGLMYEFCMMNNRVTFDKYVTKIQIEDALYN